MAVFTQFETKCEMCGKKMKSFTGLENWAILDKNTILPLCPQCSKKVKDFVKSLTRPETK